MIIKPISIAAFALALLAVILALVGFVYPRWYVISKPGVRDLERSYGLWNVVECQSGECTSRETSFIEGGREFFAICKMFAGMAIALLMAGFILHVLYVPLRVPIIRQVAIYLLGAAGLFLLLATLIFAGHYTKLKDFGSELEISLGASFTISLIAAIVTLVASIITAWASVRKANLVDDDSDDVVEIAPQFETEN